MPVPASTYRLQITPEFDLFAAADMCGYLSELGVDCVYLSPLLPSVSGSAHGYDVTAWDGIDPERGGEEGWRQLVAAARRADLKIVVDIVPNHAGVAVARENSAWWDVLLRGQASPFARWFDIEWSHRGRVLLPILGDDFDEQQLTISDGQLLYFEHRFPLADGTAHGSLTEILERQHYELVHHRRADTEHNYRRFFHVTTLAGLRVEDEDVFRATHEEVARWLERDAIDGLRVDHPDGLADPGAYLARLRALAGEGPWIVVEKILAPHETLPPMWPVDGTTGYDALAEVTSLFIDPGAASAIDDAYRTLTDDNRSLVEHEVAGKRFAIDTMLRAEVNRLARLAPDTPDAADALIELLVWFPVYRSYLPTGRAHLNAAIRKAQHQRPDLAAALSSLEPRLSDPADELCVRFQQTSAAVMAKGVEDTAWYRYNRFVCLNEVGGNPARLGHVPAAFHQAQIRRQEALPDSMTTLSTHDTKRSEDVRARLAVLSELHEPWRELVAGLMKSAPIDDKPFAYLLWQTFVGAGFIARERMHAYAEKAMREAGTSTTWRDPDTAFEASVHAAIDRAYDDQALRQPLDDFLARITPFGWSNALAQKLVQLTMPGVPDTYEGSEFWDDRLVDPDNRRPVDRSVLARALADVRSLRQPPAVDESGRAKLWITTRTLRLRREHPELFSKYLPLEAAGAATQHLVAFDRGGALTLATRLPARLADAGGWGDTVVDLGGTVYDVLTERDFAGSVPLVDLLDTYPVALLVR